MSGRSRPSPARSCPRASWYRLRKAQKPRPVDVPALTMPRIVGVEILDTHDGSQDGCRLRPGRRRPADEEARGPADGHADRRRWRSCRCHNRASRGRRSGPPAGPSVEGAAAAHHRRAHDGVEGELLRGYKSARAFTSSCHSAPEQTAADPSHTPSPACSPILMFGSTMAFFAA